MKITTFFIPKGAIEFTKSEVEYVKSWNKFFYKTLKQEQDYENQTISNTLKMLLEQRMGKQWYILLKDKVVIQMVDYWKDKWMQEMWANEYLWMVFGNDEEIKGYIKKEFETIFNKFIFQIKKIEGVKIEYEE